jgi:hypothetical protein
MIKNTRRKRLDNRPSISGFFTREVPTDTAASRPFPTAPLENVRKWCPSGAIRRQIRVA